MSQRRELPAEVSNLIRTGSVTALQTSPPRVRVRTGEIETDWLRWGERRAGANAKTWSPPSVGEQVVLLCPEGDIGQAIAVCSLYSDSQPAPADVATVERTVYGDGSVVEFDVATSTLTVNVGQGRVVVNCDAATVTAASTVELDTPQVHCTGKVSITEEATIESAASGVFRSQDGKTVTVVKGIVTKIQ
ncbi:phage baseplate assembly protein V [Stenotrophomonas sp. Iso1]|uniref:phage baseplate assembly protein V n=1 Tax=Stenotrophomonas sp. Iso1 TaxID=2977283 RepID=UPI0022B771FF|nr:phage baseplate assembly protein V [Stenotrophomonas sp. Iso1]